MTKHCVGDHTWLITLSFPFPKGAPVDLDGVFSGLRPLSLLSLGVLSTWTNFKLWAEFFCPSFVSPDCLEHWGTTGSLQFSATLFLAFLPPIPAFTVCNNAINFILCSELQDTAKKGHLWQILVNIINFGWETLGKTINPWPYSYLTSAFCRLVPEDEGASASSDLSPPAPALGDSASSDPRAAAGGGWGLVESAEGGGEVFLARLADCWWVRQSGKKSFSPLMWSACAASATSMNLSPWTRRSSVLYAPFAVKLDLVENQDLTLGGHVYFLKSVFFSILSTQLRPIFWSNSSKFWG